MARTTGDEVGRQREGADHEHWRLRTAEALLDCQRQITVLLAELMELRRFDADQDAPPDPPLLRVVAALPQQVG